MTDGRLYLLPDGQEMKVFNSRDGLGLKRLLHAGVELAIISGRSAPVVAERAAALGIKHVYQGHENKLPVFQKIIAETGISAEHSLFTGDDLTDLPVMRAAGLGIAVADAEPQVLAEADLVTTRSGGCGAVREVCEMLLAAQEPAQGAAPE
ncbi:MAG: HAD hydrolase family protein [Gammaproteobacteria bacterium]|nr:HAD hydrolase family protein [Gammaproteobacteria bacterium]